MEAQTKAEKVSEKSYHKYLSHYKTLKNQKKAVKNDANIQLTSESESSKEINELRDQNEITG